MRLRICISGRAETDLTHQYLWYLENSNAEVAARFLAGFDATIERLALHPVLGRVRKFRAQDLAGVRSFPVGGRFGVHLIFYRTAGGVLNIERVMHGARDLPRRLLEPPED